MMFSELVKQAHATALEKGWHEGEDRSLNREQCERWSEQGLAVSMTKTTVMVEEIEL